MQKLIISEREHPQSAVKKLRSIPGVRVKYVSDAGAVVFYPQEKLIEVSEAYFDAQPGKYSYLIARDC